MPARETIHVGMTAFDTPNRRENRIRYEIVE